MLRPAARARGTRAVPRRAAPCGKTSPWGVRAGRQVPRFAAVAAGQEHTVLLDTNGRVFTCGGSDCGKLGMGDEAQRFLPAQVMGLPRATGISAGHHHTMVICRTVDAEMYMHQFIEAARRLVAEEEGRMRRYADEVKRRQNAVALYQQQGLQSTQPGFNAGPHHYAARYMPETVYSSPTAGQANAHTGMGQSSSPIRRY